MQHVNDTRMMMMMMMARMKTTSMAMQKHKTMMGGIQQLSHGMVYADRVDDNVEKNVNG